MIIANMINYQSDHSAWKSIMFQGYRNYSNYAVICMDYKRFISLSRWTKNTSTSLLSVDLHRISQYLIKDHQSRFFFIFHYFSVHHDMISDFQGPDLGIV